MVPTTITIVIHNSVLDIYYKICLVNTGGPWYCKDVNIATQYTGQRVLIPYIPSFRMYYHVCKGYLTYTRSYHIKMMRILANDNHCCS